MITLVALTAFLLLTSPVVFAQDTSQEYSQVPEWAKRAVWYQVFPERFANGDATNDPTVGDIAGSWPHEKPKRWRLSPWTSDWYKLQSWEAADTAGNKGFYFHAQRRRYGGDLQGVINKLDYLSRLGVNALYFNPLFESPSLHKYDAAMYHHVDNNFGPDPAGDRTTWSRENPGDPASWRWTSADKLFLKLLKEAHKRNIRVIIDGVFNHVGRTFWAFEDVRKSQELSAYRDWFTITAFDDPATPADEFDYKGWYGVKDLPEIREDSLGLVSGPRAHVAAVVRRWMDPDGDGDPSDGIDGWRLDVADMVAMPYWREFRTLVRSINREAYITGEVWWEDWANDKMFNAGPWLDGGAFDAVMNYRWAREVCHYFIDSVNAIGPAEFERRLAALRGDYREDVNYVLMNLLDSHDTDRLTSRIVNPDMRYDHAVGLHDNPAYDVRKPTTHEVQIQKLIALFQMTYVGAPMIYYGDEVGMWGGDDPDERKPMLWANFIYDKESSHPFGAVRPADPVTADLRLYAYYKSLIGIRHAYEALSVGSYRNVVADDARRLFGFVRSYGGEQILVVINSASASLDISIPLEGLGAAGVKRELLEKNGFNVEGGALRFVLAARSGNIFELVK